MLLFSCLLILGPAASAATAKRPTLLMFHAGGFVLGNPGLLDEAARVARKLGFRPVLVDYTKADPAQALRDARRVAKRQADQGRLVYAYGESAGGTLASRLAQTRLVEAAASYSPIANVVRFADVVFEDEDVEEAYLGTEKQQRRVQPKGKSTKRPILALAAEGDDADFRRWIERWAHGDRDVTLRQVEGDHLGRDGPYAENMRSAMAWLDRKARRARSSQNRHHLRARSGD